MKSLFRIPACAWPLIVSVVLLGLGPSLSAQDTQDDESYSLKATYQIQKGSREGRIRVVVDMPATWHTYSLTQPSPPGPTEIKVKESEQFRVSGAFAAEQEVKLTENDPIFGRLEEHYDEVEFVAPLEVATGVKPENLQVDLQITCQVCSESTCEFIKKRKLEVEFDGYYEPEPSPQKKGRSAEKSPDRKSPDGKSPASKPRR